MKFEELETEGFEKLGQFENLEAFEKFEKLGKSEEA